MSTTIVTEIPVGTTYVADQLHSSVGFSVRHMAVGTFRGAFGSFDATLTQTESGLELAGTVDVASVDINDENLNAHLQSPDFFDAERAPQLLFRSVEIRRNGEELTLVGDLTIKGKTQRVEATGTIAGPAADPYGGERVGVELETAIDRTAFGLEWNAPLPGGSGFVLGNDVKLLVHLELVKA
jgi:polyisoprenoid-binding protein YceI